MSRRFVCAMLAVTACGGTEAYNGGHPATPTNAPADGTPGATAGGPASGKPGKARPETPDAPFRQTPPPEDGPLVFTPPKIDSFRLKNGTRVLLVERHDLPIVSVNVLVRGGSVGYGLAPGVASFTASMMEQGTTTRDAFRLSDDFEEIGTSHNIYAGTDVSGGTVSALVRHLDRALTLLTDVLQHPAFADDELERLRAKRLTGLSQVKNSPEAMVQNSVSVAVYGKDHPYGRVLQPDDVKKITKPDLVKAHGLLFNQRNATIVVTGDVTRATLAPKLEKAFGTWRPAPGAPAPRQAPPPAGGPARLVWVHRPGATQSQVQVVDVGPAESSPDRIPLQVMNAILGGGLTARLSMNLREAHGFTYGAYSRFVYRRTQGHFSASSGIQSQSTGPAIKEFFHELGRMRDEDVKASELADAKEQVRRGSQAAWETQSGVLNALVDMATYDRPLDYYTSLPKKIDAVTVADVRKVAAKYFRPEATKVVVVGDLSKLDLAAIEPLKLGPPEHHDEFGNTVVMGAVAAPAAAPPPPPAGGGLSGLLGGALGGSAAAPAKAPAPPAPKK